MYCIMKNDMNCLYEGKTENYHVFHLKNQGEYVKICAKCLDLIFMKGIIGLNIFEISLVMLEINRFKIFVGKIKSVCT